MASSSENTAKRKYPSFKVQIPGDTDAKISLFEKLAKVRAALTCTLQTTVDNGIILNTALDYLLEKANIAKKPSVTSRQVTCQKGQTSDEIFLTTKSSLAKMISVTEDHRRYCSSQLRLTKIVRKSHAAILTLKCQCIIGQKHCFFLTTSPKLPDGQYLVNQRMAHGYLFSGMRPSHYTRMSQAAKIGTLSKTLRKNIFDSYRSHINEEYKDATETAMFEEIAQYPIPGLGFGDNGESMEGDDEEEWFGIDIATDARHGWRKNSRDTSVVAIGLKSHKVLQHVHVTKEDDQVSQRHEKNGTEQIYNALDQNDISVRIHVHDRNMSINKLVRDRDDLVTNQNDIWHGIKSVKKALFVVSKGAQKREGVTWHKQLEDKVEPVATHIHWAVEHCKGCPDKLRQLMLACVDHYKNNHVHCHPTSRCKTDKNYQSSRIMITDPKAEKLLRDVIEQSTMYKSAKDFVLGKDTFHVESFNNTMNQFHDKRIAYGKEEYRTRSEMSVLYWNENVGREHTSMYQPKKANSQGQRKRQKKNLKSPTHKYRDNVWRRYISSVYNT